MFECGTAIMAKSAAVAAEDADGGEAGEGGLAQAVALDLPGDGRGRLFYRCYGALQGKQVSLVHTRDVT